MAIHEDELSMLRGSLPEYLWLAAIGLETNKGDDGVLGYPSALLLLSIVDAIGSYFRGNSEFTVNVDGVLREIKNDAEHLFVLNSRFFGYTLTEDQLKKLYRQGRSPLAHHALIGEDMVLAMEIPKGESFRFVNGAALIVLPQLLEDCSEAIQMFLDAAPEVVPESKVVLDLRLKSARAVAERARTKFAQGGGSPCPSQPIE